MRTPREGPRGTACLLLLAGLGSLTFAACGGGSGGAERTGNHDAALVEAAVRADAVRDLFRPAEPGGARWIDLTHTLDGEAVFWPTAEPFRLEVVEEGGREGGYYYLLNRFSMAEHGGTHLDAPLHFHREGASADEVPLDRLLGPAVVVDVTEASAMDPDYRVSVEDLEAWEEAHGTLPNGAVLLLRTGWSRFWPDARRYLGTAERGRDAVDDLHFPGLHPDAARWLVERRRIDAVGIDTPSMDHGPSTDFLAHRVLAAAGIPGFENVTRLEELPPAGAYVVALPAKIGGGSGGPLRIVAVVP